MVGMGSSRSDGVLAIWVLASFNMKRCQHEFTQSEREMGRDASGAICAYSCAVCLYTDTPGSYRYKLVGRVSNSAVPVLLVRARNA